jgi:hypothetical protein
MRAGSAGSGGIAEVEEGIHVRLMFLLLLLMVVVLLDLDKEEHETHRDEPVDSPPPSYYFMPGLRQHVGRGVRPQAALPPQANLKGGGTDADPPPPPPCSM